jgi:hypothetical protein
MLTKSMSMTIPRPRKHDIYVLMSPSIAARAGSIHQEQSHGKMQRRPAIDPDEPNINAATSLKMRSGKRGLDLVQQHPDC